MITRISRLPQHFHSPVCSSLDYPLALHLQRLGNSQFRERSRPWRRLYSSAGPPVYSYAPLKKNEIRVVQLEPRKADGKIRCSFYETTLSDGPAYECVSYCWGERKTDAMIYCDGGAIPVTKNQFSALRHLQRQAVPLRLWIDALCIDQTNVEERNQQVSLMRDIFQHSERTIVWLGEEANNSRSALELVRRLSRVSQMSAQEKRSLPNSDNLPPLYDSSWRALAALLERPWLRRAWIVQEASVTRELAIICGSDSIRWDDFIRGVQYAVELGVFVAYGGSLTFHALKIVENRSHFQTRTLPSLHDVLLRKRSFQASDARDKIFGLLSLANPHDVQAMKVHPDYALTAEELYKDVAVSLLQRSNLDAFSASRTTPNPTAISLPSWVTDWSVSDPSIPLLSPRDDEIGEDEVHPEPSAVPNFNASNSSTWSPVFDETRDLLRLEGTLIDKVVTLGSLSRTRYLRHVSHMFELFVQCSDVLELLKNWETVANVRSRTLYLTGGEPLDVYWRTLCAGQLPSNFSSARKDPRFKYYMLIRSLRRFVRLAIRIFPRSQEDTWYNRLFYSLFQSAWRILGLTPAKVQRLGFPPNSRLSNFRRMGRTAKGHLGLLPSSTREGDWISVCAGGKLPLVIRQINDKEGKKWIVIGEAYVHGLMHGEGWKNSKKEQLWFQ